MGALRCDSCHSTLARRTARHPQPVRALYPRAPATHYPCRVAGRIRDEDIALVRERTPIADVIGEYLQLRNAGGGSLKGLCPFHDEKSPSFNVTPARGLYHCLAGETRVLTFDGVRPIRELAGGVHRVLARNGQWVDAPFRSFGEQPLLRLTLSRNRQRKEIYATDEHRWFVRSGKSRKSEREVFRS